MVTGFYPAHKRLEPAKQLMRPGIVHVGAPCRRRDHVFYGFAPALQEGGDRESRGAGAGEDLGIEVHFFDLAHQRSEEHTSELQSLAYLVCRLLLEKKKKN